MIRKKTGLKELTILLLASAALVSVACGDDDDDTNPGTAGSGGSSTAGSGTGGKAGSGGGGKAGAGGKAGSDAGGKAGSGNGGTGGGTAGTGGTPAGGEGGVPAEGGGAGEGGEPMGGAPIGGAPMGGAGGEGGATEVVFDTLLNGSFEDPLAGETGAPATGTTTFPGWSNVADPTGSSKISWEGAFVKQGSVRLAQWNGGAYTATVEQEISPIANGTYSFSVWVTRNSNDSLFNESYIYAKGFNKADAEDDLREPTVGAPSEWVQIKIDNIVVDSGKLTVGFYTDTAAGDGWVNFDLAELTPVVTQ